MLKFTEFLAEQATLTEATTKDIKIDFAKLFKLVPSDVAELVIDFMDQYDGQDIVDMTEKKGVVTFELRKGINTADVATVTRSITSAFEKWKREDHGQ